MNTLWRLCYSYGLTTVALYLVRDKRAFALAWLFRQRRRASHNSDIWDLRFHLDKYLERIWRQVDSGKYQMLPPRLIRRRKQDGVVQWAAADALVMKWVALEIKGLLPLHSRCVHTTRHRGGRDNTNANTGGSFCLAN